MTRTNRFIYARVTIGAASLMVALVFSLTATAFFIQPVTEHFGFSRSLFTLNYSLITICSLPTMPLIGKAISRFGPRKIVIAGGIWAALGFVGMSFSTNLPMFYFFGAWVGLVLFSVTNLMAIVVVGIWFERLRGVMTGVVLACGGLGGVLAGLLVPQFIVAAGWQAGYLLVAGVMFGVTFVAGTVLLRNKPSDLGLLPYGVKAVADGVTVNAESYGVPYRKALASKEFWFIFIAIILFMIAMSDNEHLPAFFVDSGVTPALAGTLVSIASLVMMATNALVGYAADRVGIIRTVIVLLVAGAAGWTTMVIASGAYDLFVVGIILHAIALGVGVLPGLIVHQAFGARDFPGLMGAMLTSGTIGLSVGAPIWALVHDNFGTYVPGFYVAPFLYLLGIILVAVALSGARKKWGVQKPVGAVVEEADIAGGVKVSSQTAS